MRIVSAALAFCGLVACAATAEAKVQVAIDLTSQTMHVNSAVGSYTWPISSARSGFSTPHGSYAPTNLERMHYSRKYHMSPMPYSIFFRGGYAIHGTYSTAELGRPASHGCVRLAPGNAARLFQMVQAEGASISISGTPPQTRTYYARDYERTPAVRARRIPAYGYGYNYGYMPYGDAPVMDGWQQVPVYDWRGRY